MNPMAPTAEVIAVADDRIAAVGSREGVLGGLKLAGREYTIDDTFRDAALIPGLIEAHLHITTTGTFYQLPAYLGRYPRLGPHGMLTPYSSKAGALATLRTVAAQVKGPVSGWGYDDTTDKPGVVKGADGHGQGAALPDAIAPGQ